MPAPKNPNTEAARAKRAENTRQRKIKAALHTLWTLGEQTITADDVVRMMKEYPVYRENGLTGEWLCGYFMIDQDTLERRAEDVPRLPEPAERRAEDVPPLF